MNNDATAPRPFPFRALTAGLMIPLGGIAKGINENDMRLVVLGSVIAVIFAGIALAIGLHRVREANTVRVNYTDEAEAEAFRARLLAIDPTAHITINGK